MAANLILCKGKTADNPYRMEEAGLVFMSVEEFCYAMIYKEDVFESSLYASEFVRWIREECGRRDLADVLSEILAKDGGYVDFIMAILEMSGYADEEECESVRRYMKGIVSRTPTELAKMRADKFLQKRSYRIALEAYDQILDKLDTEVSGHLKGDIYHNIGCAYAGLFLYEEAAKYFEIAYKLNYSQDSKNCYLHAVRIAGMDAEYGQDVTYLSQEHAEPLLKEMHAILDTKEAEIERAALTRIRGLYDEGDTEAFTRELTTMINTYKAQYLKMMEPAKLTADTQGAR